MNFSHTHWNMWEKGHGIRIDNLIKIVERLEEYGVCCTLDWLIRGNDQPPDISSFRTGIPMDELTGDDIDLEGFDEKLKR